MAIVMSLEEVNNNFSRVAEEADRTGQPVTVLKNSRPWVVISPAAVEISENRNAVDVAVEFMDEYADVFEELAK